jgi:hypothetical protein
LSVLFLTLLDNSVTVSVRSATYNPSSSTIALFSFWEIFTSSVSFN